MVRFEKTGASYLAQFSFAATLIDWKHASTMRK
jgi:hypothetical protein